MWVDSSSFFLCTLAGSRTFQVLSIRIHLCRVMLCNHHPDVVSTAHSQRGLGQLFVCHAKFPSADDLWHLLNKSWSLRSCLPFECFHPTFPPVATCHNDSCRVVFTATLFFRGLYLKNGFCKAFCLHIMF